ncbi:MAG: hypothetical protein KA099_13325 [Alphaproteobacteria bacterium]|nr:hypothetical protein [Alphaproteobacteria bacterium]
MSKSKRKKAAPTARKAPPRALAAIFVAALLFPLVLFFAAEGLIALLLSNPRLIPDGYPLNLLRYYHANFERDVIQFSRDCARYDPDLFYTLKPGVCQFANREFSVTYRINSLGVRDSEAALVDPEIAVLGDSQAMGWAVTQEETYAAVLGQMTGKKVLNAGVSSYGTVREMIMLGRISPARLKYVIIQYSENDYDENRVFLDNRRRFRISPEEKYEAVRRFHMDNTKYYPGKHVVTLIKIMISPDITISDADPVAYHPDEAEVFLRVLQAAPVDLRGRQIMVFEANPYGANARPFLEKLSQEAGKSIYPAYIRNLIVLDLSRELNTGNYLRLDDHITAAGHRLIATRLAETIKKAENDSHRHR